MNPTLCTLPYLFEYWCTLPSSVAHGPGQLPAPTIHPDTLAAYRTPPPSPPPAPPLYLHCETPNDARLVSPPAPRTTPAVYTEAPFPRTAESRIFPPYRARVVSAAAYGPAGPYGPRHLHRHVKHRPRQPPLPHSRRRRRPTLGHVVLHLLPHVPLYTVRVTLTTVRVSLYIIRVTRAAADGRPLRRRGGPRCSGRARPFAEAAGTARDGIAGP